MQLSVRSCSVSLVAVLLASPVYAQDPDPLLAQNLKRLSIEELTQLDITTASRRVEPLAQVAAAVSVISGEDIRRSGVANLAEALRLADGIEVARADNGTWAISTRGFNITHRQQDPRPDRRPHRLFAAVRRHVLVGAGHAAGRHRPHRSHPRPGRRHLGRQRRQRRRQHHHEERRRYQGPARWCSARAPKSVRLRPCSSAAAARGSTTASTASSAPATRRCWRAASTPTTGCKYGAGRVPARVARRRRATVAAAGGRLRRPRGAVQRPRHARRRRRTSWAGGRGAFSPRPQFRAQAYYDHVYRRVCAQVRDVRNTVDVDLQQQFAARPSRIRRRRRRPRVAGRRQGERRVSLRPAGAPHDDRRGLRAGRDRARPGRLSLIVGSKFERNTFTGVEAQPSVRVRWTPSNRRTVWGAVSRAVRLPTRFDTDLRFTNPVDRRRDADRDRRTSRPRR